MLIPSQLTIQLSARLSVKPVAVAMQLTVRSP